MASYHEVTSGPGTFDLMLSLFKGEPVTFTLTDIGAMSGVIFKMTVPSRPMKWITIDGFFGEARAEDYFRLSYNCRNRKGGGLVGQGDCAELEEMYGGREQIDLEIEAGLAEAQKQSALDDAIDQFGAELEAAAEECAECCFPVAYCICHHGTPEDAGIIYGDSPFSLE